MRFWLGLPPVAYSAGFWYAVKLGDTVRLRALNTPNDALKEDEDGIISFLCPVDVEWALYRPKNDVYWYLASRTNFVLMAFKAHGDDLWPVSGDIRPADNWRLITAILRDRVPVEWVHE